MEKENVKMRGHIDFVLRDKDGTIKEERHMSNVMVKEGMAEAVELMIGTGTAFDAIAIGSGGDNAFDSATTELNTEYKRTTASTAADTTSFSGDTGKFIATFSFTEAKAVDESGVLNAESDGELLCMQSFADINVEDGDSLEVTWKVSLS